MRFRGSFALKDLLRVQNAPWLAMESSQGADRPCHRDCRPSGTRTVVLRG
jgi:hypothetical protein